MFFRAVMAAVFAFMSMVQPVMADRYFFRYTHGFLGTSGAGNPEDGAYDISARFVATVGDAVDVTIPLKPGTSVARWSGESGRLPSGLSLDGSTGRITGTADRVEETHLAAVGFSASGTPDSKASISFSVVAPRTASKKLDLYAHVDRHFSGSLTSGSTAVNSWAQEKALPQWLSASSSLIQGTPPAGSEGVYGIELSGQDHLGQEVAYAYGTLTVEQGPTVAHINDVMTEPDIYVEIVGKVARKIGELAWSIEGDPLPPGLSFVPGDGRIRGKVAGYSMSSTVRLVARDIDGTVGRSNFFTISTSDPVVELSEAQDQALTLGEFASFGFAAQNVSGSQPWQIKAGTLPEGLEFDSSTGVISGIPTRVERQEGIVVAVTSSDGGSDETNPFAVEVFPAPIEISSVPPLKVRIGTPFVTEQPSVTGASAPWTFSVAGGETLPVGISLDETTGVVSGQATTAGNNSVALDLTDADNRTKNFIVGIEAYDPLTVSVSPSSFTFPRMTGIAPITANVPASGIMPSDAMPFPSFTLGGSLPQGLAFNTNTGSITGTPTEEGNYGPFTVSVTDGSGQSAQSNQFTINVGPRLGLTASATATEVEAHRSVSVYIAEASGAVGAVTWALESGTLPAGLTLATDGRLQGTTTAIGEHPGIVLKATDGEGVTALTSPFSLKVVPPAALEFSHAFDWTAGRPFSVQLAATNAVGTVTFSTAPAGLPAGTSVSSAGIFSGTIAAPGIFQAEVTVTDSLGRQATGTVTVTVLPSMTMNLASEHAASLLKPVSIVPEVANAIGQTSFSRTGTLPPGLSFDRFNGEISGTPTAEGVWPGIMVTVTDEASNTRSATIEITVGPREEFAVVYDFSEPLTANSSAGLPKLPLEPTNAVGGTLFAVDGVLPSGIGFNTETGAFIGMPTLAGIFPGITVSAVDSTGATSSAGPFTITVSAAGDISVSDQSLSVRTGEFFTTPSVAYSNAVAPVSFTATKSLPSGFILTPSDGTVSGVADSPGTSVLELRLTDGSGRTKDFKLALTAVEALTLSYGNADFHQYSAATSTPDVGNLIGSPSFSLAAGNLPSGLTLNPSTGIISGTPSAQGTWPGIEISVTDQSAAPGNTARSAPFTITVSERLALTVEVPSENTILANKPYQLAAKALNAVGTVTWSIAGTLPTGLSFDPSTGIISGTPSALGTWDGITITAADAAGGSFTTQPISFTSITDGLPIRLTTYGLTTKPGVPFTTQLPKVSNAVGEVTFASYDVAAYGLSLDAVTGVVSGTVHQTTDIIANIHVTDSSNRVTSEPITIKVIPNIRVTVRTQIDTTVNSEMTPVSPVVDYAIGAVSYELIGNLPSGLSFAANGRIFGMPNELGTFGGLYIKATDSVGDTAVSHAFSVVIHESGVVPTVTVPTPPIMTAGATQANITPSWSPVKVGDVVSLNKPLPSGLAMNSADGKITGIPAAGTHGIHDGYVLTVTDAAGKSGYSEPFSLRIRHPDISSFQNQALSVRANERFESALPVHNADAVIGTLSYAKYTGFITGIDLDLESGIVSGKLTSSRNFSVRPKDSLGDHNAFSVNITVVQPSLSYTANQTIEAGTEVVIRPTVANVTDGATYAVAAGSVPPGLSFDSLTGEFWGIMPAGSFTGLSVTVTDEYGSATSNSFNLTGADYTPDPFGWADVADIGTNTMVVSDIIVPSGYTHAAATTIRTSNGTGRLYSCVGTSCSTSISETGELTITPGRGLRAEVRSSDQFGTPVTVTVTVAGMSTTWTVTTKAASDLPAPFTFADTTELARSFLATSNRVLITGITSPVPVTVGGNSDLVEWRHCGTETTNTCTTYSSAAGTVSEGRWLELRAKSSAEFSTTVTATVQVGSGSASWNLTTRDMDLTPDDFSFADTVDQKRNVGVSSDYVLIKGIPDPVPLVITGPTGTQFRTCTNAGTGCTAFVSAGTAATIDNNKYLQLRTTTSDQYDQSVTVSVTVGDTTRTWTVRTFPFDDTPDQMTFTDLVGVEPNTSVWSEILTVSGIFEPVQASVSGNASARLRKCAGGNCSTGLGPLSVSPGNTLQLLVTSGAPGATVSVTLKVGQMTTVWSVTTRP